MGKGRGEEDEGWDTNLGVTEGSSAVVLRLWLTLCLRIVSMPTLKDQDVLVLGEERG